MRQQLKSLIGCALMAALTSLLSQLVIPMVPVPINMAMLAVFMAGGLLGPYYGVVSQLVFLGLGLIGLPVFANFGAGFGTLAGPTGGYIIGYIAAAFLTGLFLRNGKKSVLQHILGMGIGLIVCYAFGTIWFMLVTKSGLWQSLLLCVFPFLVGDAIKITLATMLVKRLSPILKLNDRKRDIYERCD